MLKEIVITLFIAGCVAALPQAPTDNDQLINERNGRIVGGGDALITQIPSMVSIMRLGSLICGGSILNINSILTAAHCTGDEAPSIFQVRVGSNSISIGGLVVPVSRVILHPSYNGRTLFNDIAVLKLSRNLAFSASVAIIALPAPNLVVAHASMAQISGWGGINTRGDRSPAVLQRLQVPVVGNAQCAAIIGSPLRVDHLCAGGVVGRDACFGDEGGPLIANDRVVGVLSWSPSMQCANGWPMVYTRVSAYIPFINGSMLN